MVRARSPAIMTIICTFALAGGAAAHEPVVLSVDEMDHVTAGGAWFSGSSIAIGNPSYVQIVASANVFVGVVAPDTAFVPVALRQPVGFPQWPWRALPQ